MWRLGYRAPRKKNPESNYWEYAYVPGEIDDALERAKELHETLGLTKFSIEWREENKNV